MISMKTLPEFLSFFTRPTPGTLVTAHTGDTERFHHASGRLYAELQLTPDRQDEFDAAARALRDTKIATIRAATELRDAAVEEAGRIYDAAVVDANKEFEDGKRELFWRSMRPVESTLELSLDQSTPALSELKAVGAV